MTEFTLCTVGSSPPFRTVTRSVYACSVNTGWGTDAAVTLRAKRNAASTTQTSGRFVIIVYRKELSNSAFRIGASRERMVQQKRGT